LMPPLGILGNPLFTGQTKPKEKGAVESHPIQGFNNTIISLDSSSLNLVKADKNFSIFDSNYVKAKTFVVHQSLTKTLIT